MGGGGGSAAAPPQQTPQVLHHVLRLVRLHVEGVDDLERVLHILHGEHDLGERTHPAHPMGGAPTSGTSTLNAEDLVRPQCLDSQEEATQFISDVWNI